MITSPRTSLLVLASDFSTGIDDDESSVFFLARFLDFDFLLVLVLDASLDPAVSCNKVRSKSDR